MGQLNQVPPTPAPGVSPVPVPGSGAPAAPGTIPAPPTTPAGNPCHQSYHYHIVGTNISFATVYYDSLKKMYWQLP